MARRNRRGGVQEADLDDVNRREDLAGVHRRLDELTEAMEALLQQRPVTPVTRDGAENDNDDNPFGPFADAPRPPRPHADGLENDTRWESAFRMDIPEFHGNVNAEEFLDWIMAVEEVLDFKAVPDARRAPLVTTRFRGRAAAWWTQTKTRRARMGKAKLVSWDKLKKHMKAAFLPYNYARTLYQSLQNLRQGTKSVTDYSTEFFMLLARNDIAETEEQTVSRYIGGLRVAIQDVLNMFDPLTVAEAHQRALAIERQQSRRNYNSPTTVPPNRGPATALPVPRANPAAHPALPSAPATAPPNVGGGIRCFGCGESGHRRNVCPKNTRPGLFTDDAQELFGDPIYDDDVEPDDDVEEVAGDVGHALVVQRSFLSPPGRDDGWLRNNIFQSSCTIGGKVCRFVIDSGSCENVVAEEVVTKLGLNPEKHPKPYKLAWLQTGTDVTVSKRVLVSFSIGSTYKDTIMCDIVSMDACHLLLRRPWQFDRHAMHNGLANTLLELI